MNISIFHGKKFYIISTNDADIKSILTDAGANYQSYLSESLSFAISDSPTASEVGEVYELYDVNVVTSEWVRLCFQWGKLQYMKAFHPAIRNLFNNFKFLIFNINDEDTEKLTAYIRIFGGSMGSSLTEDVTHVIIGVIEGEGYDRVVEQCNAKTVLVTPNWLIECINSRQLTPTEPFQPQVLFERLKQLQISTETERASQSKRAVATPTVDPPKRPISDPVGPISSGQQFSLSGLQQAVPISIQDSLLTRQLPSALSRQQESPAYSACRAMPTAGPRTSSVQQPASGTSTMPSTPVPGLKNKASKASNNNKHLHEQSLNESEKDAIVMQNVMSILGQSHPRRSPAVSVSGSDKASTATTTKKPRSPRPKTSTKNPNLSGAALVTNSGSTKTSAVPAVVSQQSGSLSSQQIPSAALISTPVAAVSSNTVQDSRIDPNSPKIDVNSMRSLQHQILAVNQANSGSANTVRFGVVGGTMTGANSVPQSPVTRTQIQEQQELDKIVYNPGNMLTTQSTIPNQQMIVQQSALQTGAPQSMFARQPQRLMQQQQQQQQQIQQIQQQHKQLITLGQIQTPGHQIQQHWQNAVHMSPNQHASPTILSPGGLCATVTGTGVQQGPHQMYQLTSQQALTRNGIINNGNQMMLNNLGNGMPINAQCASMVTNVTGPLHLQTPIGNGNPATLMLHQQQLHVTGNLPSSAMQSPNNSSGNPNLNMTPGKILTNQCARSIIQHPNQIPQGVRVTNPSYSVLQPSTQGINPTNTAGEHGHHQNNAHLSRPFPGLLRLPQYLGHEGVTTGICRENCLIGCVFYLYGYNDIGQAKRDNWLSAIRSHGAETVNVCNFQTVTHLIVDCQLEDPDLFKLALRSKTRVVTIYWVNDVIEKGHLEPPFEIIHLPSPFSKNLSFSYIRRQIVSITGFEGEERKKVEYMVIQLGVRYTEYLEASNTVLICKKAIGRKYDAAQKLGIVCVNVRWLQDLYFGDLQTLSNDIDHKYQCFESSYVSIRLERHTHRVQELMVGWLIPIRLDDNSWKRLRLLRDQCEAEKISRKRQAEITALQSPVNSKKPKWDLPSLSDEDRKMADLSPSKYTKIPIYGKIENNLGLDIKAEKISENVDEFLQQYENRSPIIVAFTGLMPEQRDKLTDLLISLGGEVTDDMNRFTHLVAKNIVRTPKFYFGILRGCQIVSMKWIQACAYRQQFIDEKPWRLEDREGERQYGFSLHESLARAQNRLLNNLQPLFHSLEFFLSPRAKHRQVCIDLIRACGGTIREKRPIQKMALMPEPKHLIICHEDDSHLANYLTRTKTGNKAVHHEEFVLSGVMRQELDYDSYQIQYVSVMKNAFNNHVSMPITIEHHPETIQSTRHSPPRSTISDPVIESTDTKPNQSELYRGPSQIPQTTPSFDQTLFTIKSEPTVPKYHEANIFNKLSQNSVSFSVTNNSAIISHREPELSHSTEHFSKISNSDIKIEDSLYEDPLSGCEQSLYPPISAAEATLVFCKDQIVGLSSPDQEMFGMKVDDPPIQAGAISCSMVPINMSRGSALSIIGTGRSETEPGLQQPGSNGKEDQLPLSPSDG